MDNHTMIHLYQLAGVNRSMKMDKKTRMTNANNNCKAYRFYVILLIALLIFNEASKVRVGK